MTRLTRLAAAVVVLLALLGLGAGTAAAQEPTPPPVAPVAPVTGIADEGNAFQQDRRECLADTLDGNALQNFMNGITGEVVAEGACLLNSFPTTN